MEVRLLEREDAEAYWTLRLEALQDSPEAFASSYEEALQKENPIAQVEQNLASASTFGAFRDGQLVGVATLARERQLKLKHRANIFAVYVTPAARGLGIGKLLMKATIDLARTINDIEKLNLSVVSTNAPAKKLYECFGFQTFGVEEKAMIVDGQYIAEDLMTMLIR